MAVDSSAEKKRTKLLTLVVRLPRLDDSALDRLAVEVSTRPSTYMYSTFPSDAIDSPSGTVDVTGHERDGDQS